MKTYKKISTFLALSFGLLVLTVLFSCKKDDDNTHEIEFRVSTSANAHIDAVTYTNVQGEATNLTEINSNNWSAKVTVQGGVKVVSLTATGVAADASGSMKVQILSNGSVVAESSASGQVLSNSTTYVLIK